MNLLESTLDQPLIMEDATASLTLPVLLGLGLHLAALAIGLPYATAGLGLAAGLAATLAWANRPLAWIVFVALLAASPANPTTPIALDLYAGMVFFLLSPRLGWKRMPRLVQLALLLALVSLAASLLASLSLVRRVPSISITDVDLPRTYSTTWAGGPTEALFPTQLLAVVNYLLGPLLFLPLAFSRIRQEHPEDTLLKGWVYGLVYPTLLLFLAARAFGRPVVDANVFLGESLMNVSTYRLGMLDIQMIRTQSGIILAALTCARFAVAISPVPRGTRLASVAGLGVSLYLMLMTGSVGSSLAALAGMVVIVILGKRRFPVRRYLALLLVGGCLGMAAWAVLPEGTRRYATTRYELRVGKSGDPFGGRAVRWRKSLAFLERHPSGVGWSVYLEPLGIYPHNDYLTYAIAYGVLCGLVYLACPVGLLLAFLTVDLKRLEASRFALALAGAGVAAVLLINSMSDHLTANRWYFNVVWCLVWYAFFASRPARVATGP
jgi:hypothetical protein